MYRSILVPLDGSPFGEHALPLALSIARRARASLQVVHVYVPLAPLFAESHAGFDSSFDPLLKEQSRAYLDDVVRRLKDVSGVPVTSAFLEGTVVDALREQVAARGAELVVMTTHGRGTVARAWLGSVADQLVRRMPVPVLLVRPHDGTPDLAQEPNRRHVLITLDGSRLAEQVLEPAVALGSLLEADYTLLQVIKPMLLGNLGTADGFVSGLDPTALEQLQTLHDQEKGQATAYLERVARGLRARSLRVQTRVVAHEQPAVAILDEVRARAPGLVALETHGRSGLSRMFLGSVADKVVRAASVPVLIHHGLHQEGR